MEQRTLKQQENEVGIRYIVFAGKEARLTHKEKWFKSIAKRDKFIEKLQESGNLYELTAYSN